MFSRCFAWRFLNYPAHAFHVDLFSPSCCQTRASHGTTSPLSFPLCRSLSESRSSSCVRSIDQVSLRSSGSNAQIRLRTVCEPFRDTALTVLSTWPGHLPPLRMLQLHVGGIIGWKSMIC